MRLLHTATLAFQTRRARDEYSILSHRWDSDDDQEISYEDAKAGNWKEGTTGYEKLIGACRKAKELGYQWIWIDTCCIDKSSNNELSEAINSMYSWYAEAAICIVYLSDVCNDAVYESRQSRGWPSLDVSHLINPLNNELLYTSSWFTRGWTLQELLAPENVQFYDKDYQHLGSKKSLSSQISQITKIDEKYLLHREQIATACIAHKLHWMSSRVTKRKEDESYCMLGLLKVNMPLLYGEKDRAFLRLQRELLNQYDDDSIFAWASSTCSDESAISGLLADSPRDFAESWRIVQQRRPRSAITPYSWTHKGIMLHTRPTKWWIAERSTTFIDLAYAIPHENSDYTFSEPRYERSGPSSLPVSIQLVPIGESWYRIQCNRLHNAKAHASIRSGLLDLTIDMLSVLMGHKRQAIYVAQSHLVTAESLMRKVEGKGLRAAIAVVQTMWTACLLFLCCLLLAGILEHLSYTIQSHPRLLVFLLVFSVISLPLLGLLDSVLSERVIRGPSAAADSAAESCFPFRPVPIYRSSLDSIRSHMRRQRLSDDESRRGHTFLQRDWGDASMREHRFLQHDQGEDADDELVSGDHSDNEAQDYQHRSSRLDTSTDQDRWYHHKYRDMVAYED